MPSAPFNANSMQPFGSWQLTNTVLKVFGQSMTTPAVLSAPVFSHPFCILYPFENKILSFLPMPQCLNNGGFFCVCLCGWSCMISKQKLVSINQTTTLIISLLGHMLKTLRTSFWKKENIIFDVKLMDVSCSVCDNDTRISKSRESFQTCLSCFM